MELFHKTFFYVIYSKMAVNYRMYEIMRKFTVKVLWNMPLVPCLLRCPNVKILLTFCRRQNLLKREEKI